ncbi:MAG: TPM domain-containing protein [Clostridiales bacterium]|nr:TPM domain-containing protein [Candidatus Crickella merdequi]
MKKIISICVTLSMTLGLLFASMAGVTAQSNSNRIIDSADLLTDYEEQQLELSLADWCDTNQFDIVVLTEYGNRSNDDGSSALTQRADDYFDYNGYGYGENYDGCILVIDMGSREACISTSGYGETAITDFGIESLLDDIVGELAYENYYDAISDCFIDSVEWMYDQAKSGNVYDYSSASEYSFSDAAPGMFGFALIPSLLASFGMASRKKRQLKSVRKKHEAHNYVRPGSMQLYREYDRFLYSNVVATPKPKDNDGGHMGGSTIHTSSSGRSHGGGSRHF